MDDGPDVIDVAGINRGMQQFADALTALLAPYVDALNQLGRTLAPLMEVRSQRMSAMHREYHRRQRARQKRR